jgi:hypothetical protein
MSEKSYSILEKVKKIRYFLWFCLILVIIPVMYFNITDTGEGAYWCLAPIMFVILIPLLIIRFGIAYGWFDENEKK